MERIVGLLICLVGTLLIHAIGICFIRGFQLFKRHRRVPFDPRHRRSKLRCEAIHVLLRGGSKTGPGSINSLNELRAR